MSLTWQSVLLCQYGWLLCATLHHAGPLRTIDCSGKDWELKAVKMCERNKVRWMSPRWLVLLSASDSL